MAGHPEVPGGGGGDAPGGDGDELTRADLSLIQQALRQEWALSPKAKRQLLQTLVDIATTNKYARNKVAAAKAIALFMRLNLAQGALDLAREKHQGGGDFSLAEVVAEAEAIAAGHAPAARPAPEREGVSP